MNIVFATYDGLLAGPGRSQSVPYVRGLSERGHRFHVLSYEAAERTADASAVAAVERDLGGVPWRRVRWHRRPLRDLPAGLRALRRTWRALGGELVHARGYVPAFLARALRLPYVFDMRGFWPDERADGGLWRRGGLQYRTWKRIERSLCRCAAAVVVLTERAREELHGSGLVPAARTVHVIPTCADLTRFRPFPPRERVSAAQGAERRYVILGGTGTWYLRDEMLDLAARALAREPDAVLQVLTQDDPRPIVAALDARGVATSRRLVRSVPHDDVARWLSGAAAGIMFIRPAWSKRASCPTKLAEFLGCGVPLILNAGVGDVDRLLADERVGVTVDGFDADAYDAALAELDALSGADPEGLSTRCRALAERRFSLAQGVRAYERVYADAAERSA